MCSKAKSEREVKRSDPSEDKEYEFVGSPKQIQSEELTSKLQACAREAFSAKIATFCGENPVFVCEADGV